jgi:hypothetical protein
VKSQITHWSLARTKSDYASCEDFCKLFAKNVESFYLLCFLLTASPEKAEQCFVARLNDCVNGISVFHEWVDCWARRVMIRRAVRLIQPRSGDAAPRMCAIHPPEEDNLQWIALQKAPFARVLALEDFERFAFVLSVLEGYPDQGCAILLGASRQEIREARVRAFGHLAGTCSSEVASLA